jgi:uncharacterized protein
VIPTRSECLTALRDNGVPDNIIGHSIVVERVALVLSERLIDAGNSMDTALVSAGALLHDIEKMRGIREGRPHGELGAETIDRLGFPEVSPIVGQHVRLADYGDNGGIDVAKLVNYADKRVNHEEIVTLDERFDYLFDRYGAVSPEAMERMLEMKRLTNAVERQIFSRLAIAPTDVKRLVEEQYGFYTRQACHR